MSKRLPTLPSINARDVLLVVAYLADRPVDQRSLGHIAAHADLTCDAAYRTLRDELDGWVVLDPIDQGSDRFGYTLSYHARRDPDLIRKVNSTQRGSSTHPWNPESWLNSLS